MQDLVDANTLSLIIKTLDISQEAEIDDLFRTVERDFGRIDYAANCAVCQQCLAMLLQGRSSDFLQGVLSQPQTSHETSAADFDKINGINYRGCWLTSRAEIRMMLRQEPLPSHDGRPGNRGSIVNIASQLGIVGRPAARKLSLCHTSLSNAMPC